MSNESSYEFDPVARTVRYWQRGYTSELYSERALQAMAWKDCEAFVAYLDGNGYIPRGVQAEPKQLFEVGKVYRQQDGEIVRLDAEPFSIANVKSNEDYAYATQLKGVNPVGNLGGRLFSNGRYVGFASLERCGSHLVPGELIFRDGQWIAADEEKTETIPGKKLLETLNKRLGGGWVTTPVDFQIGFRKQTTEPNRPRLTWADTKPSDRWDGYTVKKRDFTPDGDSREQSGLCLSPDLSEVSPLCGSAWLVLGE